jgi:hypothetical protein
LVDVMAGEVAEKFRAVMAADLADLDRRLANARGDLERARVAVDELAAERDELAGLLRHHEKGVKS